MKHIITSIVIAFAFGTAAQLSEEEIKKHRDEHKSDLLDTNGHLLNNEEIKEFGGLSYFDFDSTYQITGKLIKDKGPKFEMPTSTERLPVYRRYGYFEFMVDSASYRLTVYQNVDLIRRDRKAYKNFIFIPFKDGTTRNETYGGGRFIEMYLPEGDLMMLDFNLAFNPYCAYSHRYSCPIPPEENTLDVRIEAGEKTPLAH